MRVLAALILLQSTVNAFFSINYSANEGHPALMTLPGVFKDVPNAEHVADIYARLSGLPPILREGDICNARKVMRKSWGNILTQLIILRTY